MAKEKKNNGKKRGAAWLPDREVKALARCFLPAIREFYETEEGRSAFAEWKRKETEKERQAKERSEAGTAGKDGCGDGKA